MKVIILAGGYGTRLAEYTDVIPKPMVMVGDHPILWHIMRTYAYYGHKDFYLALGYKLEVIKKYFLTFNAINSDFSLDLSDGKVTMHNSSGIDWNVTLVDTGYDTMTGGRVKRLQSYIGNEPFLLTYGDGVSDVNIDDLIKFHRRHGRMVTVTAVHPAARFGEISLKGDRVASFKEKPQLAHGWINGGFFVIEPSFFELLDDDNSVLEAEPLEQAASMGELMAFKNEGFWQCMDTKRDNDYLNQLWQSNNAPWRV